jgi:uncharacterized protein (DUF736 family)
MAIIGLFSATSDGGWEGKIRTLTVNVRAKFVPNDNRVSEKSPDYLVLVGPIELGAAWVRRCKEAPAKEYLTVQLDDPCLAEPLTATLLLFPGNDRAKLVWSRRSH